MTEAPADSAATLEAPQQPAQEAWPRLSWTQRGALAAAVLATTVSAVPRLPPGVCYGDSGDLQTAAATLGIAHPPGYAIYASLGWLLTRLPIGEPAYLISLACFSAGLVAILLAMLTAVRLGTSAFVAGVFGAVLPAHPTIWRNLLAPEVYAPTLALVAGSVYLLLKYDRLGRPRHLYIAALLFGVAAGSRYPIALALPILFIAWLFARKQWEPNWRVGLRRLALAGTLMAAPILYSAGYVYVRDAGARYNYLDQYNDEYDAFPPIDAGAQGRLERTLWLVSGRQYDGLLGTDAMGVYNKLRWLRGELELDPIGTLVGVILLGMFGLCVSWRRSRAAPWLLLAMVLQAAVYVCAYRVHGQAADVTPLVWAVAVALMMGVSPLFAIAPRRIVRVAGPVLLIAACAWAVYGGRTRYNYAGGEDASRFITKVEMGSLPPNTVICSTWPQSTALWYAQHVMTNRPDIRIINAWPETWLELIGDLDARPVYFASQPRDLPPGYGVQSERLMFRLIPAEPNSRGNEGNEVVLE